MYQFSIKTFCIGPVITIIIIIESIILRFVQDTYAKLNSFQLSHHHPPDLVVGSLMSLIQFISSGFNKSLVVKLHEYLVATCGCKWVGTRVGQFSLCLLFQRKNPKQREPSGEVMNPKQREPSGEVMNPKQREPLGEVWVYMDHLCRLSKCDYLQGSKG